MWKSEIFEKFQLEKKSEHLWKSEENCYKGENYLKKIVKIKQIGNL